MNLEEALKRIEVLEAEVARLKTWPQQVSHSHYHYVLPQFYPQPSVPAWPQYPQITWGGQ